MLVSGTSISANTRCAKLGVVSEELRGNKAKAIASTAAYAIVLSISKNGGSNCLMIQQADISGAFGV